MQFLLYSEADKQKKKEAVICDTAKARKVN